MVSSVRVDPTTVPHFQVVPGWERLPEGYHHGDAVGVAVDSQDRVYLLTRREPRCLVYAPDGAFLFPQMTMTDEALRQTGQRRWSPNFVDYLFLAFNTSTAFSPADTFPLTVRAKLLMMAESAISFATIALVASRAVGILN